MHVNFTVHDHKENIIHSRDFVFSLSLITVQPPSLQTSVCLLQDTSCLPILDVESDWKQVNPKPHFIYSKVLN